MKKNIQILIPKQSFNKIETISNLVTKADQGIKFNKSDTNLFVKKVDGLRNSLNYYISLSGNIELSSIVVSKKIAKEIKEFTMLCKIAANHKSAATTNPKTQEQIFLDLKEISKRLLTFLEEILKSQKIIQGE